MIISLSRLCLFLFCISIPGNVYSGVYKIVAFGDSTTAMRGNLNIYSKRLEQKKIREGYQIRMVNSGIPGNNTTQAKKRFQKDVLNHQPDLVIIQFGINDAAVDVYKNPPATKSRVSKTEYKNNLLHFISILNSKKIHVILMTPNPCSWTKSLKKSYGKPPYNPDEADGFNVLLKDYAEIVREISRSKKVPLVDVYQEFNDYGMNKGKSVNDLLLDGMHPNDAGHEIIADFIMKMIIKVENAN